MARQRRPPGSRAVPGNAARPRPRRLFVSTSDLGLVARALACNPRASRPGGGAKTGEIAMTRRSVSAIAASARDRCGGGSACHSCGDTRDQRLPLPDLRLGDIHRDLSWKLWTDTCAVRLSHHQRWGVPGHRLLAHMVRDESLLVVLESRELRPGVGPQSNQRVEGAVIV